MVAVPTIAVVSVPVVSTSALRVNLESASQFVSSTIAIESTTLPKTGLKRISDFSITIVSVTALIAGRPGYPTPASGNMSVRTLADIGSQSVPVSVENVIEPWIIWNG